MKIRNMKLTSMFGPIVAFTILGSLVLAFGYDVKKRVSEKPLPQTGWQAGFHSFHATGYDTVPVQVFSVLSEINQGLVGVRIKNRSEKVVTSVRLGWYVSDAEGSGSILTQGETTVLKVHLSSLESSKITVPNVTWDEILRPLMKKGTLHGDFDIWVAVNKVTYDDGSEWTLPKPGNVTRASEKKNNHAVEETGCADQTCKKNGDVYKCIDGPGELCTNHNTSCESTICTSIIQ